MYYGLMCTTVLGRQRCLAPGVTKVLRLTARDELLLTLDPVPKYPDRVALMGGVEFKTKLGFVQANGTSFVAELLRAQHGQFKCVTSVDGVDDNDYQVNIAIAVRGLHDREGTPHV